MIMTKRTVVRRHSRKGTKGVMKHERKIKDYPVPNYAKGTSAESIRKSDLLEEATANGTYHLLRGKPVKVIGQRGVDVLVQTKGGTKRTVFRTELA